MQKLFSLTSSGEDMKLLDERILQIFATIFFGSAILHTFLCPQFNHIAKKFKEGSLSENFFHLLGEVEVTFGLWAGFFISFMAISSGTTRVVEYIESLHFTEPIFVFAIMVLSSTRPVLTTAHSLILAFAKVAPAKWEGVVTYGAYLSIGPLLGSLITEPAAMTITALMLGQRFFSQKVSSKFKYSTLAGLFVNVSVGGVLTSFAAPPVLMVSGRWNWDTSFMFNQFGWKAVIAVLLNVLLLLAINFRELKSLPKKEAEKKIGIPPHWLRAIYIGLLLLVVFTAHIPALFLGIFLFFLGIHSIAKEFNDELKLRESLLVAFFLAGLVVLGGFQKWWLEPILLKLSGVELFLSTTILTAFADNAALTYLGSQIENTTELFKYALVSGAVAGGGLTVIANAPNPAGYSILQSYFGEGGISAWRLFISALIPTLVAMACFWFL